MGARRKARALSFQAIYSWEMGRHRLDEILQFSWEPAEGKDLEEVLEFARTLTKGTIEHISKIDQLIGRYSEHWDISRIAKVDLAVLRLSVFSLLYQVEIPSKVVIDEAIELTKRFGSSDSFRFVNGLLDGIRQGENLEQERK